MVPTYVGGHSLGPASPVPRHFYDYLPTQIYNQNPPPCPDVVLQRDSARYIKQEENFVAAHHELYKHSRNDELSGRTSLFGRLFCCLQLFSVPRSQ
jgi:hypothetical protein